MALGYEQIKWGEVPYGNPDFSFDNEARSYHLIYSYASCLRENIIKWWDLASIMIPEPLLIEAKSMEFAGLPGAQGSRAS